MRRQINISKKQTLSSKNTHIRINEYAKQRLDEYRGSHPRGSKSYSAAICDLISRNKRMEDKLLRMPWRYKVMHKWVFHGDTNELLEKLKEDVTHICGIEDPDDVDYWMLNNSPKDMRDALEFLMKRDRYF